MAMSLSFIRCMAGTHDRGIRLRCGEKGTGGRWSGSLSVAGDIGSPYMGRSPKKDSPGPAAMTGECPARWKTHMAPRPQIRQEGPEP